jgi:DNA-binding SARP family transcriptional activator
LRAEARVEASSASGATTVASTVLSDLAVGEQSSHSQNALLDVEQALERLDTLVKSDGRSDKSAQTIFLELKARAHRAAADANEALGRFSQAMAELKQWADCKKDPTYQAKAVKEIQRIQARQGKSSLRM